MTDGVSPKETLSLDQLVATAELHRVAEELTGNPFKRQGKEWVGLCQFHGDRSPSLSINDEKGVYHCWSCGASGNAVQLIRRTTNCTFKEAVAFLLRFAGLEEGAVALPSSASSRAREGERRVERELQQQRLAELWCVSAALRRNRQQHTRALLRHERVKEYIAEIQPIMQRRGELIDKVFELTGSYDCPELW